MKNSLSRLFFVGGKKLDIAYFFFAILWAIRRRYESVK